VSTLVDPHVAGHPKAESAKAFPGCVVVGSSVKFQKGLLGQVLGAVKARPESAEEQE
jgi:hypothetical protein